MKFAVGSTLIILLSPWLLASPAVSAGVGPKDATPAQDNATSQTAAELPAEAPRKLPVVSDATLSPGIKVGDLLDDETDAVADMMGAPALEFQEQDNPELVDPDVSSYQFYITDLESRYGAYAQGLDEQLLGLGVAYQNQGLHREAVKVFKRAVHLARIHNGLNSEAQIPILKRLIGSHIAAGDYDLADERQYYLYRIQRKAFRSNPELLSSAILQRAEWEKQAYQLSVGDASFMRLMSMWDLYRKALSHIAGTQGKHASAMEKPLTGLIQTQYLIHQYDGESSSGFQFDSGGSGGCGLEENRFSMLRSSNFKQGSAVIQALREVYQANENEQSPLPAETLIAQGDWHLTYEKRNSALSYYREAWNELAALDDGEVYLKRHFARPVMLPTQPGMHNDLEPAREKRGYAYLEYSVNERGRVYTIDTLQTEMLDAEDNGSPVRLVRQLKNKVFRPRFENGDPVVTEDIVERYAF